MIKTPPVSHFVKKAIGKPLGAQKPGHETAGSISLQHIYEIAVRRCFTWTLHPCFSNLPRCTCGWKGALISLLVWHQVCSCLCQAIKQLDHPGLSLQSLCKSVMGTCRSMGVAVEKPPRQAVAAGAKAAA